MFQISNNGLFTNPCIWSFVWYFINNLNGKTNCVILIIIIIIYIIIND